MVHGGKLEGWNLQQCKPGLASPSKTIVLQTKPRWHAGDWELIPCSIKSGKQQELSISGKPLGWAGVWVPFPFSWGRSLQSWRPKDRGQLSVTQCSSWTAGDPSPPCWCFWSGHRKLAAMPALPLPGEFSIPENVKYYQTCTGSGFTQTNGIWYFGNIGKIFQGRNYKIKSWF